MPLDALTYSLIKGHDHVRKVSSIQATALSDGVFLLDTYRSIVDDDAYNGWASRPAFAMNVPDTILNYSRVS